MQITIFICGALVLLAATIFMLIPGLIRQHQRKLNICILFSIPLLSIAIYLNTGSLTTLATTAAKQSLAINDFVMRLEKKLRDSPNDVKVLNLAGKTYRALGKYEKAAAVYKNLHALNSDDADILSAWAEAQMLAAGGVMPKSALEIIKRALEINPEHMHSLWLAALAAESNQDYEEAAEILQQILKTTDDESQSKTAHDLLMKIKHALQHD